MRNLTPELQEQIRKEAKSEAKKMTARVPVFRVGYEYGHYDGAEVYAEKWQEEKELRERYEKALKAIAKPIAYLQQKAEEEGASLDGYFAQELARSAAFLQSLADEALTPKKQVQMTQLTGKIFAIPMPKGAESCEIRWPHPGRPYPLLSFYGEGAAVELPPGEYRIVVFNTGNATEEDARKVVASLPVGRKKVYKGVRDDGSEVWYESAVKSLASLLRSKSLDPKNNYALIEKESTNE